jgi:hypothetical protein
MDMLFVPKINTFVGAWVMSGCVRKHGMTRNAINCYNGKVNGNNYADKVMKAFYRQEAKYASR